MLSENFQTAILLDTKMCEAFLESDEMMNHSFNYALVEVHKLKFE